jgi:hypothetical protein
MIQGQILARTIFALNLLIFRGTKHIFIRTRTAFFTLALDKALGIGNARLLGAVNMHHSK